MYGNCTGTMRVLNVASFVQKKMRGPRRRCTEGSVTVHTALCLSAVGEEMMDTGKMGRTSRTLIQKDQRERERSPKLKERSRRLDLGLLLQDAITHTVSTGQRHPGVAGGRADDEDVAETRGEGVFALVDQVDDVERTRVLLGLSNGSNAANVVTACE